MAFRSGQGIKRDLLAIDMINLKIPVFIELTFRFIKKRVGLFRVPGLGNINIEYYSYIGA